MRCRPASIMSRFHAIASAVMLSAVLFGAPGASSQQPDVAATADEQKRTISIMLADTEDVWGRVFKSFGKSYKEPLLILFRRELPTACGTGDTATGPFYCTLDQRLYLDLDWFQELAEQQREPASIAKAYVISHEVGHHVQTLLGIDDRVQQLMARTTDPAERNRLSVRLELQADCLAGVTGALSDRLKGRGWKTDIADAIAAVARLGNDRLQRAAQGFIVPESFTHGTSERRVRWFMKGFESGQMQSCDTFSASDL